MNIPLPAGSGTGAYLAAFERLVSHRRRRVGRRPLVVACGYDASALDPLGRMELHSGSFRELTSW